jgi:hypothetical protein
VSLLLFKKQFPGAIRSGTKRSTIRRRNRPRVRAGHNAFAPGLGWLAIESVDPIELRGLSDHDAIADGFATAARMRRALRRVYPATDRDRKTWFRVRFRIA